LDFLVADAIRELDVLARLRGCPQITFTTSGLLSWPDG
jgi:hypothetical protein